MYLAGLQKLTLLDFPGKVACTVFTAGCNFRCGFCHNASLVLRPGQAAPMSMEEFFAFLQKRRGILDGVCVTGGEPLLHEDLPALLAGIRELGFAVKLDTNGSDPQRLEWILTQHLVDYVAMDLKNCAARYGETIGLPDFDVEPIRRSVELLMSSGTPYEFRTTIVKKLHDLPEIREMGRWIQGANAWFLQNFVDSGDLIDPETTGHEEEKMRALLAAAQEFIPSASLRGV